MNDIYTRDYGRGRRGGYNPPPGYVGTAFEGGGMKMHEADVDISTLQRDRFVEEAEETVTDDSELQDILPHPMEIERTDDPGRRDRGKLEDLIRSLRGKLGMEEIILILILLVISSDGIGIEALVLGLLLMVK